MMVFMGLLLLEIQNAPTVASAWLTPPSKISVPLGSGPGHAAPQCGQRSLSMGRFRPQAAHGTKRGQSAMSRKAINPAMLKAKAIPAQLHARRQEN
jgi:hypothetical protein